MSPPMRSISHTELEVLKGLWDLGDATVRDLQEYLQKRGRSWAYTTVQTLLNRLQRKRLVTSDKSGRAHVFRTAVSRDELLSEQLGDLAHRVGGGAVPLMVSLVQGMRFSPEEIRQLRELVDDLEAEGASGRQDPKVAKKRAPGGRHRSAGA